jgi:lysyl-tRNA synthetase class 1
MERLAAEKGAPLEDAERDVALERIQAAEAWLEHFAPPEARLAIQYDALPASARELTEAQRRYLAALADAAEGADPAGGDAWQALIFETAKQADLKAGEAFGAIYRAFLDRTNGPRAGWLLASLDRAFVIRRMREASA